MLSCILLTAAADQKRCECRDSKLTRALQDCLGGQARTMLIVCCAQASNLACSAILPLS